MSAVFADEVVTQAHVRYLRVPGLAGELALVTLDNGHDHTRPSTFGPGGLAALDAALDEIAAHTPAPVGIAVTGKPFIFAVGADLSGVPSITSADDAREIAETGHRVFRRLKDSPVPTFAFVNGAALGGGLELALHCAYRTIASTAVVAFPEVFLGLVPGWGGTQLLPNLIGIDAAVGVIVENALAQNKVTPGPRAAKLGIADAVFEPADFLERSLEWAVGVLAGDVAVPRPEVDRSAWDDAIGRARQVVAARTRNASPGALRAVQLLDRARAGDAGFTAGTAAEDDALTELLMSDELRAGLYSFDLVNKRAKRPAGAPDRKLARKVTKVGVVGAGLMASQLALLFLRRLEVPVVLTDIDQARVDRGVGYVHGELDKLADRGRLSPDARGRLKGLVTGALDKAAFADADLVIEAVFEELSVKQQVFAEVEAVVSAECVLATNTSALSVTEMASQLQHPERVVGLHFFNPVAVLPLLEVVRAERTDDATLATAFAVGKALKKSCVLVADAPAFVVNRLLTRFLGEITSAVDAGRRRGAGAGPPRPAHDAVRAAVAGRPAGRAARRGADARGVPGPVRRRRGPAEDGRARQGVGLQLPRRSRPRAGRDRLGRLPAHRRAAALQRGAGAGRGDRADARRGRRARRAGHRPGHAAGRGLAVLAGRHLRVPGPGRGLRVRPRRAVPAQGRGLAAGMSTRPAGDQVP